jgi:hypothetical protein
MASDTPQTAPTKRLPAICIGHSHSSNVAEAAAAAGIAIDVLNFWVLNSEVIQTPQGTDFGPALRARLAPTGPALPVFSLIGGAVHHDIGLVQHPTPYDFVDPADAAAPLVPGATLVPYDAVVTALQTRMAPYLAMMDTVRRLCAGAVYHLQSPPVFADEVLNGIDAAYWAAYHGQPLPISPAYFRKKLWRLHSAIVARHSDATGITFVPCPPESMDAAGYLRPGLNAHAAHANAAYGALLLRQIAERCGSLAILQGVGHTARHVNPQLGA